MRNIIVLFFALSLASCQKSIDGSVSAEGVVADATIGQKFFPAPDVRMPITGRYQGNRFWSPGVYFSTIFNGPSCRIILRDERKNGQHNKVTISVDNKPGQTIQLPAALDTIVAASGLQNVDHVLTVTKDTEGAQGWVEVVGVLANSIRAPYLSPNWLVFFGDSQTSGAEVDISKWPCGTGQYYDRADAYDTYAAITARSFNARYEMNSVSGIGMARSKDGGYTMPMVSDKIDLADNLFPWTYGTYRPAAVIICLGQNDGDIDSNTFCKMYLSFIAKKRAQYPFSRIVCLTSPMGGSAININLTARLKYIVAASNDPNVSYYAFKGSYWHGCSSHHPDKSEQQQMGLELIAYLKPLLHW